MKRRVEHIGHSCLSAVHLLINLREQMEGHACMAALVGLVAAAYFVMAVAAERR